MFASYSVLELDNFDSGLLISPPLYASTKHDRFCVKRNLEKTCSLNISRSLLKQNFWV